LTNRNKAQHLSISPARGRYRAAAAVSFDCETSAPYGDRANIKAKFRGRCLNLLRKVYPLKKDLSFCYGIGYAMRHGTEQIMRILQKYGVHATWFATGHALLKENIGGWAFNADRMLPYAGKEAGFEDIFTWRKDRTMLFYEPYSTCEKYPYWYLGDQMSRLRSLGEDIQCHTFSHSYIAMEKAQDVKADIENWQRVAQERGFGKASALAFPFCGDAYVRYPGTALRAMIGKDGKEKDCVTVPISDEIVEVLKKCGIELLTRCGSKAGEGYRPMSVYNDSGLHYLSDINIDTNNLDFRSLDNVIEEITGNQCAVNFWMHPANVFTTEEIGNFEALIAYLSEKSKEAGIWLTTVSQIWDYCKKVKNCEMSITSYKGNRYKAIIDNHNETDIEELTLDILDPTLRIIQHDADIDYSERAASIRRIRPGEQYEFIYEVSK